MAFTNAEKMTLLEILALRGEPGTDERTEFEAAIDVAEADDGRETQIRGYIAQWNAISTAPVATTGEKQYSTAAHRLEVRNKVAIALGYEVLTLVEYQPPADGAQWVTIQLPGLYGTDEYAG